MDYKSGAALLKEEMASMHMKRHMPQIYMSKKVKEGKSGNMNDFNAMLKKSLLSPRKQRYVTTKHEHEAI